MALENVIRERIKKKSICVMTHVIAGYPSFEENLRELDVMAQHDVDLLEIQMPFSEPIADGPVFTGANLESLQRGTTIDRYFSFMEKVTQRFDFPVLLMGYYNTVFMMGVQRFAERLQQAGGRGFIIPDLPLELSADLYTAAQQQDLAPIALVTPTTPDERLAQLGQSGSGFVYVVARKGVTGSHTSFERSFDDYLARCRAATSLPLAVGFGISEKADLDVLRGKAEVAIIGTAVLRAWEQNQEQGLHTFFRSLLNN